MGGWLFSDTIFSRPRVANRIRRRESGGAHRRGIIRLSGAAAIRREGERWLHVPGDGFVRRGLLNGLKVRIEHVEVEAVGRQQCRHASPHTRPCVIGRTGDGGVQAEQKLATAAIDGRRLAERQTQTHRGLKSHAGSGHVLIGEQSHKTAAVSAPG